MWFVKAAVVSAIAALLPFGLADAGLVVVSALLARPRWDTVYPEADRFTGAWLFWILICAIAALFSHGGPVAAGLAFAAAVGSRTLIPHLGPERTQPERAASVFLMLIGAALSTTILAAIVTAMAASATPTAVAGPYSEDDAIHHAFDDLIPAARR